MNNPVLEIIKAMVDKAGSQVVVAQELEITPSYLCEILRGTRDISENMAHKLGFRKIVTFEPLEERQ